MKPQLRQRWPAWAWMSIGVFLLLAGTVVLTQAEIRLRLPEKWTQTLRLANLLFTGGEGMESTEPDNQTPDSDEQSLFQRLESKTAHAWRRMKSPYRTLERRYRWLLMVLN